MGIASVIHQIAIQIVDANTALASMVKPSGWKNNKTKINAKGPRIKPIFLELSFIP